MASNIGENDGPCAAVADEAAPGVAGFVGHKAGRAVEAIGVGIERVGEAIREHAPAQGVLGNAGRAVGENLTCGGRFLEEQGLTGIADSIGQRIRRNPVPALLIGLGIGLAAARLLRR